MRLWLQTNRGASNNACIEALGRLGYANVGRTLVNQLRLSLTGKSLAVDPKRAPRSSAPSPGLVAFVMRPASPGPAAQDRCESCGMVIARPSGQCRC